MSNFSFKTDSGEWRPIEKPSEDIETDGALFADDFDCLKIKESHEIKIARANEILKNFVILSEKLKEIAESRKELLAPEDVTKEKIKALERRKKHCKNYLELNQIDRELNALKWGRRKKVN